MGGRHIPLLTKQMDAFSLFGTMLNLYQVCSIGINEVQKHCAVLWNIKSVMVNSLSSKVIVTRPTYFSLDTQTNHEKLHSDIFWYACMEYQWTVWIPSLDWAAIFGCFRHLSERWVTIETCVARALGDVTRVFCLYTDKPVKGVRLAHL